MHFFPLKSLCLLFIGKKALHMRALTSLLYMLKIFFFLVLVYLSISKFHFSHMDILNLYNPNLALFFFFPVSAFGIGLRKSYPVSLHYVNGTFIASLKNLNA